MGIFCESIRSLILHHMKKSKFRKWLRLRANSKNEYGEKLCYCGHTDMCECGDPDFTTFKDAVERGAIILNDPKNGWKSASNI